MKSFFTALTINNDGIALCPQHKIIKRKNGKEK